MTSEKWKRWSTLPDPHVAYFNGKQLKLSAENTETSEQSLEMACGNQQCFEFNPVVLSAFSNKALDQTQLHVNWNQCLQICTRSAHGYHTTAVHLVLIRRIFNGHIYILKRYTYCIILHYKMYKSCRKQWNDSLVHVHMNL